MAILSNNGNRKQLLHRKTPGACTICPAEAFTRQGAGFAYNPGKVNGSGGTSFGDSGGLVFRGDSDVVGALVSWGITPCIGTV